jgi:hypothetical protein
MSRFPRLAADPGRIFPNRDVPVAELELALFNVPEEFQSSGMATLFLAASSSSPGWRRQLVEIRHMGRTHVVQTARCKSILGRIVTRFGPPSADGAVELVLHDLDQWLLNCSDEDLELGDNLAAIGDEIIQFGEATSLGAGRFRLGRLLRGRWGTQGAVGSHREGEAFVLIERGALQPIALPAFMPGLPVCASALNGKAECSLIPSSSATGRKGRT